MAVKAKASSEGAAPGGVTSGRTPLRGPPQEGYAGSQTDSGTGGRARVADIQRARMLGAMVQEIAKRGVANVSVAHVVGRSGVSRRTFYEIFDDREDCFLAAFDEALRGIAGVVVPAFEEPHSWRARVRAGLTATLECFDYDRDTARLLIVESLAAGPKALQRRQAVLGQIIEVIEQGRTEGIGRTDPPPLTAEGIVGGVLSVLHSRLTEPSRSNGQSADQVDGSLVELAGPLMGMIVLPYIGPTIARKEIARPTPKREAKRPLIRRDPLADLEMRLTYRTLRVLTAVAQNPGSSNRALGDTAGIADQGQVSKLLARLQRLGLVENKGIGANTRGEPNAWTLTDKGREVHDTISNVPT